MTFPLIQQADVEMISVPEGQICSEMLDLYQVDGVIDGVVSEDARHRSEGFDLVHGIGRRVGEPQHHR